MCVIEVSHVPMCFMAVCACMISFYVSVLYELAVILVSVFLSHGEGDAPVI